MGIEKFRLDYGCSVCPDREKNLKKCSQLKDDKRCLLYTNISVVLHNLDKARRPSFYEQGLITIALNAGRV